MLRISLACGMVCAVVLHSAAFGQGFFGASPPLPGERGAERVRRIFDETSPAIGEPLPDLTCHDAEGNEFKLASLKGRHSVLLFGCLT